MGQALHKEESTIVSVVSPYIHALNGRLRIKVAEVKSAPARALEVEGQLRKIDGINRVKANPTTGNVLILYHPEQIEQAEVIGALRHLGCLRESAAIRTTASGTALAVAGVGEALAETLVRSTMELALQRLISTLI
jgi:copper chaperone CopZ